MIGNLNINSLLNKFEQLKYIVMQHNDFLVLTESKFEDTFAMAQFSVNAFQNRTDLTEIKTGSRL